MAIVQIGKIPPPTPVRPEKAPSEHRRLCDLAVRWLRRSNSARGPGCLFAISEAWSDYRMEIPDAIGWRISQASQSVVVEVKVSRADFLADASKPHRQDPAKGMGRWRYYMCPEGVIQPDDLPPKWGLLWVRGRSITPVHGPATVLRAQDGRTNYHEYQRLLAEFAHEHANTVSEHVLLTRLIGRLGDPEQTNKTLRDQTRRILALEEDNIRLRQENRALRFQVHYPSKVQEEA